MWIAPESHPYVPLSDTEKEQIAMFLEMELIDIPPQHIFIGYGYVQHAGAGWDGTHCLRDNIYVIPEGSDLRDAILYAYGRSFIRRSDINPPDI